MWHEIASLQTVPSGSSGSSKGWTMARYMKTAEEIVETESSKKSWILIGALALMGSSVTVIRHQTEVGRQRFIYQTYTDLSIKEHGLRENCHARL